MNFLKRYIVLHQESNERNLTAIGALLSLIPAYWNMYLLGVLLISFLVLYFFYKVKMVRIKDGVLEKGMLKGLFKSFKPNESIHIKDFLKVEVIKNNSNFFEIKVIAVDDKSMFICAMPNKNPALEKAEFIECEIKKVGLAVLGI